MKSSLFLLLSLSCFNLFASDCTYQSTEDLELSYAVTAELEYLGCVEAPESKRAPNHLKISMITYFDTAGESVEARTTIFNLRNGKVINVNASQSIHRNITFGERTYGPEDFERARVKAIKKAQQKLAREIADGWIHE